MAEFRHSFDNNYEVWSVDETATLKLHFLALQTKTAKASEIVSSYTSQDTLLPWLSFHLEFFMFQCQNKNNDNHSIKNSYVQHHQTYSGYISESLKQICCPNSTALVTSQREK